MQLPLFLLRRNPLGLKPRGLFDLFDKDSEDEDASPVDGGADAPSLGGGTPHEVAAPWVADEPAQESPLDYARRQAQLALWEIATLGTGGLTRNPLTGEIYASKYATRLGDRMSEIAQQVPFGPGRAGGPSRPAGPAAVRTQPRSEPGFLFGGPQAETAENQAYSLRRRDDAEAAQQSGSDFLFGVPQTVGDTKDQVYHLPPPEDGSDEDSEESPEQKAINGRTAARAKEHRDAFCLREWNRERLWCADKFSYSRDAHGRCERQAYKLYSACLTDKDNYERRWTDDQENGGWRPKTPDEKRREKWKRPRAQSG